MKLRFTLATAAPLALLSFSGMADARLDAGWTAQERQVIRAWPARKAARLDAGIEARIARIVAGMTLEQKIGQMTQAEIRSITPDQVRQYYIGTILNGGGAWPGMNKAATLADWTKLAAAYSAGAMSTDMNIRIPLIWGIDAVHGNNNVRGATTFPHNIGLGAANDLNLMHRIGRATARQVRATGINWAFAPTVAVVQNQRWGRAYESYSSDPALVARNGAALIRGLQGQLNGDGDVLASVKHFAGDGGTAGGIDQGENRSPLAQYVKVDGAGYYAALDAGVQTVMISYNSWTMLVPAGDAVPFGKMHGNRAMITGVLKQRLKFDGLVVSDWNAIEQIPGCTRDHCPQAINAGTDVFMVPDDWKAFIANTVADVREGRVPMARIDDAVTRILRVKFRAGMFDRGVLSGRFTGQQTALTDRPLAQEAVRKSAVLLKNNRGALPLKTGKKILVVGAAADSFPIQSGGWTVTWQGDDTTNADFTTGETLLAGLRRVYGDANVTWSPDGGAIDGGKFDAVLAVLGETPHAETKGDVRWPAPIGQSVQYPADKALLDRVAGRGLPVITVLYSGRTTYATDLINRSDAFVAAFLPGSEAGALAELFAGQRGYAFSGRLSFAWPNTTCPGNGYPLTQQLFARGYGLSYAKARRIGALQEAPAILTCP
ncbi:MAG: glycoside hydrolase family 3 protein [Novosphingobium sp.]|uniref:glycoside hydrolase family 3 protein n=1 Tax=Novosphingobium sp. TaxID=1874826 RepID=UPI0032BC7972